MSLNLLHIDKSSPQLFCHSNTVSGCAGMVRSAESCQIRLVFHYHVRVCSKTAGCQNYGSTVYGKCLAVLIRSCYPAHLAAVIYQNLFCCRFQKHRYSQFFCLCIKSLHKHRTYCRCIRRPVNTLYACSAEHAYNT